MTYLLSLGNSFFFPNILFIDIFKIEEIDNTTISCQYKSDKAKEQVVSAMETRQNQDKINTTNQKQNPDQDLRI